MLRSVEIENFKNFTQKQTIELCHPHDFCGFTVVVGRNGTGKSCVMEAIEWTLFDSTRKDVRTGNTEQLVNSQLSDRNRNMSVTVTLVHPLTRAKFEVRKNYRGKRIRFTGTLIINSQPVESVHTYAEIAAILLDRFGLDTAHRDRMIVKQSATAVVRRSKVDLLEFVERMVGTLGLAQRVAELGAEAGVVHTASLGAAEELAASQKDTAAMRALVQEQQGRIGRGVDDMARLVNCLREQEFLLSAQHRSLARRLVALLQPAVIAAETAASLAETALRDAIGALATAHTNRDHHRSTVEAQQAALRAAQTQAETLERQVSRVVAQLESVTDQAATVEAETAALHATLAANAAEQERVEQARARVRHEAEEYRLAATGGTGDGVVVDIEALRSAVEAQEGLDQTRRCAWERYSAATARLQADITVVDKRARCVRARLNELRHTEVELQVQHQSAVTVVSDAEAQAHLCWQEQAELMGCQEKLRGRLQHVVGIAADSRCVASMRRCRAVQERMGECGGGDADVLGTLGDLIQPIDGAHTAALLTRFSANELAGTVVVRSREAARRVTQACVGTAPGPPILGGVSLLIADEYRPMTATAAGDRQRDCLPLLSTVRAGHPLLQNYLAQRCRGWSVYAGTAGHGEARTRAVLGLVRGRRGRAGGVVTLDGEQFQGNGEIATGVGRRGADVHLGTGAVWPTSQCLAESAIANANTRCVPEGRAQLEQQLVTSAAQLAAVVESLDRHTAAVTNGQARLRAHASALLHARERVAACEAELGANKTVSGSLSHQRGRLVTALTKLEMAHAASEGKADIAEAAQSAVLKQLGSSVSVLAALAGEQQCMLSLVESARELVRLGCERQVTERQLKRGETIRKGRSKGSAESLRRKYRELLSRGVASEPNSISAWSYTEHVGVVRELKEVQHMGTEELLGLRTLLAKAVASADAGRAAVTQRTQDARRSMDALVAARAAAAAGTQTVAASDSRLFCVRTTLMQRSADMAELRARFDQGWAAVRVADELADAAGMLRGGGDEAGAASENGCAYGGEPLLSSECLATKYPEWVYKHDCEVTIDAPKGKRKRLRGQRAAGETQHADAGQGVVHSVSELRSLDRVLETLQTRAYALVLDAEAEAKAATGADPNIVNEYAARVGVLVSESKALAELQERRADLQAAQQEAYTSRCELVLAALGNVNRCIGRIYAYLTGRGGAGATRDPIDVLTARDGAPRGLQEVLGGQDTAGGGAGCYLHFPADADSLFAEGVCLLACTPGTGMGMVSWLEASKLSGGQQCACAVALLLALQETSSPPAKAPTTMGFVDTNVYLLDEIDASLDSAVAFRLGRLLQYKAYQSRRHTAAAAALTAVSPGKVQVTQFICVSHRPELHASASRLVGVHAHWHSSSGVHATDADTETGNAAAAVNSPCILSVCFHRAHLHVDAPNDNTLEGSEKCPGENVGSVGASPAPVVAAPASPVKCARRRLRRRQGNVLPPISEQVIPDNSGSSDFEFC